MAQLFNADEIYQMGVQIEKNGFSFYTNAAKSTDNADLKDLFSRLADWEKEHITIFEYLRTNLPPGAMETDVFDPENMVHLYLKSVADNVVFVKGLSLQPENQVWTSPVAILKMALEFEKDSVVFFSSMKEVSVNAAGAAEVDKLILEELRHIGYLTTEIRKLEG